MVVPTGTATPWREMPYEGGGDDDLVVYLRDGWVTESADLLAEALRADGVVRILSHALSVAEDATLDAGWYGYVDESRDETVCNSTGETADGEVVDYARPCVFALAHVRE